MDVIAMTGTSPQGLTPEHVRQCGLCHKPFLKESSFNRHVLYCRRTRHRPRTRVKVCQACSSAKVKCNLQPQCQRCVDKGIECIYDISTGGVLAPSKESRAARESQLSPDTQTSTLDWPANEDTPQPSDALYARDDSNNHMDWNLLDFEGDQLMPQSPKNAFPCLPIDTIDSRGSLANDHFVSEIMDFRTGDFNPQTLVASEPPWPSRMNSQGERSSALTRTAGLSEQIEGDHLLPIPKSDPLANHTAKIVMEMLRAFPQMMLRRETLPPFIHGHWYDTPSSIESALPQPLLNCMGLAQVFASRALETRSFLWRTIQTEQRVAMEKADHGRLTKHAFIASIQAQLIYIMMRITDNSAAETGFNFQLLVIFQRLCERLKNLLKQPFFQQECQNPSLNWEDWIFAESRRRVAIVWLLITQMVHIKIGVPCDSFPEFREIPLPAPRSLWEARTRKSWQSEFDIYKTTSRLGMETVGDLITASAPSNASINKMRLDTWNSGIDSLGLLLNLSVALL